MTFLHWRLISVDEVSPLESRFTFMAGNVDVARRVSVLVKCEEQPGSPWGAQAYVIPEFQSDGPRHPEGPTEKRACELAVRMCLGEAWAA